MLRVADYLVLSLTGAFTLAIGLAAISAPADARKLGKAAAGAVAVAAGKSSARAATPEKSNDTQDAETAVEAEAAGEPQSAGDTETAGKIETVEKKASPAATKPSDSERTARIEAAAARAKAQLAAEKTDGASLAPTSSRVAPVDATAAVCVAGCGYSQPINR